MDGFSKTKISLRSVESNTYKESKLFIKFYYLKTDVSNLNPTNFTLVIVYSLSISSFLECIHDLLKHLPQLKLLGQPVIHELFSIIQKVK